MMRHKTISVANPMVLNVTDSTYNYCSVANIETAKPWLELNYDAILDSYLVHNTTLGVVTLLGKC